MLTIRGSKTNCEQQINKTTNKLTSSYRVDIVVHTTQADSGSIRSPGHRRCHARRTRNAQSSSDRSAARHTAARIAHLFARDHTDIYRWLDRTLSRQRSHTRCCSSFHSVLRRTLHSRHAKWLIQGGVKTYEDEICNFSKNNLTFFTFSVLMCKVCLHYPCNF